MKLQENYPLLFLKISVHLTGFSEIELQSTGMLTSYFDTLVNNIDTENLTAFFKEVDSILIEGNDENKIDEKIRLNLIPDTKHVGLAKKIISLWYMGVWKKQGHEFPELISGEAYVQALMWPAAKTHPPGAKQPGYSSWNKQPL